jgi:hypothetical protein
MTDDGFQVAMISQRHCQNWRRIAETVLESQFKSHQTPKCPRIQSDVNEIFVIDWNLWIAHVLHSHGHKWHSSFLSRYVWSCSFEYLTNTRLYECKLDTFTSWMFIVARSRDVQTSKKWCLLSSCWDGRENPDDAIFLVSNSECSDQNQSCEQEIAQRKDSLFTRNVVEVPTFHHHQVS